MLAPPSLSFLSPSLSIYGMMFRRRYIVYINTVCSTLRVHVDSRQIYPTIYMFKYTYSTCLNPPTCRAVLAHFSLSGSLKQCWNTSKICSTKADSSATSASGLFLDVEWYTNGQWFLCASLTAISWMRSQTRTDKLFFVAPESAMLPREPHRCSSFSFTGPSPQRERRDGDWAKVWRWMSLASQAASVSPLQANKMMRFPRSFLLCSYTTGRWTSSPDKQQQQV